MPNLGVPKEMKFFPPMYIGKIPVIMTMIFSKLNIRIFFTSSFQESEFKLFFCIGKLELFERPAFQIFQAGESL